jgi:beta-lactamase regulating signal transducer with metallopeptidase domain
VITSLLRLDLESAVVSSLPMLLLLLKATCLLLAALGASLLLQRASAGVRHLVWLVAVAALLVLPALAAWSPLRLEVLPESFAAAGRATPPVVDVSQPVALPGTPEAARSVSQSNVVRQPAGGVDASRSPAAVDGMTSAPLTVRSVASMALTVWGSVAAILAAWLAFGALSVYRIVRRARPLSSPEWQTPLYEIADRFGLTDAPRLLRSDDVKMPFACGLFHPTIVLPAESDDWSADRRSAVLLLVPPARLDRRPKASLRK